MLLRCKFLASAGALLLLAAVSAAAGGQVTDEGSAATGTAAATARTGEYGEAPMLAALVAAGELPPVEERLPDEPVLVEPFDTVGTYGGTLRSWWLRTSYTGIPEDLGRYMEFARQKWDRSGELIPDMADRWEVSADKRSTTVHIRDGMKWSDGEPFTSADLTFWFDDILPHGDLVSLYGYRMSRNRANWPEQLEAVDGQTFRVSFSEPNGIFLNNVSYWNGHISWWGFPRHYLSQFHPDHAGQAAVDKLTKEAGFDNWEQLLADRADWFTNPELPVAGAIFQIERPADETGRAILVRNPYFHRIDTAGNQLPYIDRMSMVQYTDNEIATVNTIAGEVDFHHFSFRAQNWPVLKQNEGRFQVGTNRSDKGGEFSLFLNQTTTDPVARELFSDLRFRQAVSLAMNREEVVQVVFSGLAEVRQASNGPGPLHSDELSGWFADYDPTRANALLDEMGLTRRDANGFRMMPDGRPIEITLFYDTSRGWDDAYELCAEYIEDIGINVDLIAIERAIWFDHVGTNEKQGTFWSFDPGISKLPYLLPGWTGNGSRSFGMAWGDWYRSGGTKGEAPPADYQRILELHDLAAKAPSIEEQVRLVREADELFVKNLYVIGLFGLDIRPATVHNRLKNVPLDYMYASFVPAPGGVALPEQWYIDPAMRLSGE